MENYTIESLLTSWQMPIEVVEAFQKNGIEINHLSQLTDENLKELCPRMGVRIDLKFKISEFIDAQANTETATESTSKSVASLSNTDEVVQDFSFSISDLFPNKTSFKDFDLLTLLETSPCGKSIMQYYAVNGSLDTTRRNRLTDIIVRHLFTFLVNQRLTNDDYNILAAKIVTVFPKENAAIYFTNPIKKAESHQGKSIAARGKLIDKVRNIIYTSGERRRRSAANQGPDAKKKENYDTLLELYSEDIQWLNKHEEPREEVVKKWRNTFEVRHSKDYDNIQQFLFEWKILKDPKYVDLINEDFEFLHPGKGDNFTKNWQQFFEKVLELKSCEITSDAHKENLLSTLKCLNAEEEIIPTQLTLLVNLVPPKGRHSKKNKFSIQECLESIVILVENPGDINKTVEEQKVKALARKLPVQPYLILQGSALKVCKSYLVIDEIRYTFDSVPTAFDTLFKCYHALDAKYPRASDHILLIIQRCVYNIITKYDNPVPYISDILTLTIN